MIYDQRIGENNSRLPEVHAYIESNKLARVLDVGGAAKVCSPLVTHVLDFEPHKLGDAPPFKIFAGNMELASTWEQVYDDVKVNGKFDFVSCTHTLEDLNCPEQIVVRLAEVGKMGFISMPSKFTETAHIEDCYGWSGYIGYHHHRWLYTVKDGKLLGFPKTGVLEYRQWNITMKKVNEHNSKFPNGRSEISFCWKDDIPHDFTYPHQYLHNFEEDNRSRTDDIEAEDDFTAQF